MNILIAGGRGFLGTALQRLLQSSGHVVWVLTRREPDGEHQLQWDGRSANGWSSQLAGMDVVVHATGFGLEHWPWTASQKRRFVDSRVMPGLALAAAIEAARPRPRTFVQISGINYYGATGGGIADESWPPAGDFLAQLTVKWEQATQALEGLGVRRVVARSAVLLDAHGGLFPLMVLPVRLGIGGPLGAGDQAVPWIHLQDEVAALKFLIENEQASGPFNLIAPQPTSNADLMRAVALSLHRPYWFRTPGFLLRIALGGMSTLVLEGRYSQPKRLSEFGFKFRFATLDAALGNLFA